jgi:hypothetical protein
VATVATTRRFTIRVSVLFVTGSVLKNGFVSPDVLIPDCSAPRTVMAWNPPGLRMQTVAPVKTCGNVAG